MLLCYEMLQFGQKAELWHLGLFSICTDCGRIGADLGRVQKVVFNDNTCLGAFTAEGPAEIINASYRNIQAVTGKGIDDCTDPVVGNNPFAAVQEKTAPHLKDNNVDIRPLSFFPQFPPPSPDILPALTAYQNLPPASVYLFFHNLNTISRSSALPSNRFFTRPPAYNHTARHPTVSFSLLFHPCYHFPDSNIFIHPFPNLY